MPEIAILFWVYKEPELCANRVRLLRRYNPDLPIWVLYGGPAEEAAAFEDKLGQVVDDFYAFQEAWPPERKWLHGDQLIATWHRERGAALPWTTVFIAQWDLLMLDPVPKLCGTLRQDELLLPGLRPIREVMDWWWWTRPGSEERAEYNHFLERLGEAAPVDPLCCNFLAAALPRSFLDRYADLTDPDVGFLEYKIPVLAQSWGFEFCRSHAFNPVWHFERRWNRVLRLFDTMHAEKGEIAPLIAKLHSMLPGGRRAFHPFTRPFG